MNFFTEWICRIIQIPGGCREASSKVEKENTHYQGLPEDVGPDSGKSWSQRSRKMKRDKTRRSRKRKRSEVERKAY